jgi:hypothetical protein
MEKGSAAVGNLPDFCAGACTEAALHVEDPPYAWA